MDTKITANGNRFMIKNHIDSAEALQFEYST